MTGPDGLMRCRELEPARPGARLVRSTDFLERGPGCMDSEFLAAMAGAGIVPSRPGQITPDGKLVRFHCHGDRRGSRNGWAVLTAGGWGVFGSWRSGARGTWAAHLTPVSPTESARMGAAADKARRQREADRLACQEAAAKRASQMWGAAQPDKTLHPYLIRKRIRPPGLRQTGSLLLVPLRDTTGFLWNLQTIRPTGCKRFLRGGRVIGLYCALGGPVVDRVCVAEGLATAASIFEATSIPTAAAMSAGNLSAVAIALATKFPQSEVVVAADRDPVGIQAAQRAARAVGGRIAYPPRCRHD
jgi:putative DNA primase/helicase